MADSDIIHPKKGNSFHSLPEHVIATELPPLQLTKIHPLKQVVDHDLRNSLVKSLFPRSKIPFHTQPLSLFLIHNYSTCHTKKASDIAYISVYQ